MNKVLIAAPISGFKQYSLKQWIQWIKNQAYEHYDVLLCINGKEDQAPLYNTLKDIEWTDVHGNTKKLLIKWQQDIAPLSINQRLVYARHTVQEYFLARAEYTHLLWLDTDTIPCISDAIPRLLSHKLLYVSGLYFYKQSQQAVMVDMETGTNLTPEKARRLVEKQKLGEIALSGMGCCLMKRKLFEFASFDFARYKDEHGDDYGFCRQVRDAGLHMWVDPIVLCDHLGEVDTNRVMNVEKAQVLNK